MTTIVKESDLNSLTSEQQLLLNNGGCMEDYEVIKAIGKGKFSVVYRAKRKLDDRVVALKKVAIFDMMDAKARDKTLKEVRLLQSLEHPNIIKYLDAFIDQNELIIVFEWAEAGDLKRQIRKAVEKTSRFEENVIWRYFGQICEAIQHMHNCRIIHRDIKPANIFLTLQGVVKVGDLGLGKHLSENTMEAHSKVGTPLYMSPEVLKGNGYDWKSDIWSLGCILYELAMLRSPFKSDGLDLYRLFQKINKGDYEPLPETYSFDLRQLVNRMLSVDAMHRPSITEICNVAKFQRERPPSAPSSISSTSKPMSKQIEEIKKPSSAEQTQNKRRQLSPNDTDTLMSYLMEKIRDILLMHRYHKPIHLNHFIEESPARQQQYFDMIHLMEWSFEKLKSQVSIDYQANKTVITTTVLNTCISLGFTNDVAPSLAITPVTIGRAFGLPVCILLDWILKKVQDQQCLMWKAPIYPLELNEEVCDHVEEDQQDETMEIEEGESLSSSNVVSDSLYENVPPMILPQISPTDWKREQEIAVPKILSRLRSIKEFPLKNWDARLSTFWHYLPYLEHVSTIGQHTKELHEKVLGDCIRITNLESRLNTQLGTFQKEFEKCRQMELEFRKKVKKEQERVAKKVVGLEKLTNELDLAKQNLAQKSDQLADITPLSNIREAIRTLRLQMTQLDVRLGIALERNWKISSTRVIPNHLE